MTLVPAESTTLAAREAIVVGQILEEPLQVVAGDKFTGFITLLTAIAFIWATRLCVSYFTSECEPLRVVAEDIFTHYKGLLQAATIPFMQYESWWYYQKE
jgi:hypothetical protein